MIRSIIIDDEPRSCETLQGLLDRYCPQIKIEAVAYGYFDGIQAIRRIKPELVFLDIQMPDGSGFKLLENIENSFKVIFTTAFDQYAIKAIRYSALDYLLKPIIPEELINAVQKAAKGIETTENHLKLNTLLENVSSSDKMNKIVLSTSEKMHVVEVEDIIRCESDNYYTNFFFRGGDKLLISKTLKDVESLLSEHKFLRPHKSHLVNIRHIKSYSRSDGGRIIMTDDSNVPVSRRKKEKVTEIIHHIGNL